MSNHTILKYIGILFILAGCAGTGGMRSSDIDWSASYDASTAGAPYIMYGTESAGYGSTDQTGTEHQMAVLLPLSGQHAPIGRTIRTSVEMAILESGLENLNVSFYDTNDDLSETFSTILAASPEIIVGPLFSGDAKYIRDNRPSNIPVLSFTSDAASLGDGVMTMNLMPTHGVETIIREMQTDGIKKFIVMAPDTESGHLMAGTALDASHAYNLPLIGIFYYAEKDPESIKNAGLSASMNNTRRSAHTRARQVLSDILINENLTALEKYDLNRQLEKLSKTETLGSIPYDGILFLGNGEDTKSLASYLRYYDVSARDARFYGTTMWDGSNIASDLTMSGAKFATLPQTSPEFTETYKQMTGVAPNRLASFGYDATNMAIGMIYSDKSSVAYLLDPSGYIGTDGLFRLTPNGASERGMRIVALDGSGTPRDIKPAPTDFTTPPYSIDPHQIKPADTMELQTPGVDPDDYITIPDRIKSKYRSKTIGANVIAPPLVQPSAPIEIPSQSDNEIVIRASSYEPVRLESIQRSYIDEYEIIESE